MFFDSDDSMLWRLFDVLFQGVVYGAPVIGALFL